MGSWGLSIAKVRVIIAIMNDVGGACECIYLEDSVAMVSRAPCCHYFDEVLTAEAGMEQEKTAP